MAIAASCSVRKYPVPFVPTQVASFETNGNGAGVNIELAVLTADVRFVDGHTAIWTTR